MKLLAIDTATEACSAALWIDRQIYQRFTEQPKGHGGLILKMMEGLLNDAQINLENLDALTFGRGPGAFTGVRIATAIAQAIGFGTNLPVIPVSNLAALAQCGYRKYGLLRAIAALDARMGEVYVGAYEIRNDLANLVIAEQVVSPSKFTLPDNNIWNGIGRGWKTYREQLETSLSEVIFTVHPNDLCEAQDLLPLALDAIKSINVASPKNALPVYLRNQVTAR